MARRTYRVQADRVDTLVDILVAIPDEFNLDKDSLRGRAVNGTEWISFGRLSNEHKDSFRKPGLEYVIFSYLTPIAWRTNGQWVMPDVRYTVQTSKHQGKVRNALSQISGGI